MPFYVVLLWPDCGSFGIKGQAEKYDLGCYLRPCSSLRVKLPLGKLELSPKVMVFSGPKLWSMVISGSMALLQVRDSAVFCGSG